MKHELVIIKPKQKLLIQHKGTGLKRKVEVIRVYDSNKVLIKNERGRDELIELLEYIILILPLLDRIIIWFKKWFKRN